MGRRFVQDVEGVLDAGRVSDLDGVPSLKEFEALARERLGSDEGFAPAENGWTNEANFRRAAAEITEEGGAQIGSWRASAGPPGPCRDGSAGGIVGGDGANNAGMPEAEDGEGQKAVGRGQ